MVVKGLFARSPFQPLIAHYELAVACAEMADGLLERLGPENKDDLLAQVKELSKLEGQADVIMNDFRRTLHKGLFMPVDRRDLLAIINEADDVANAAEDLGVLLTLRDMEVPENLALPLARLREQVLLVVREVHGAYGRLDSLVEVGFSGAGATELDAHIEEVCQLEHEADKAQDIFGKAIFAMEDDLSAGALLMWIQISKTLGEIANAAERAATMMRLLLLR
jgi:predicted phosphate transport protein (TIGR00153 family)